jgi:hypothetical protein
VKSPCLSALSLIGSINLKRISNSLCYDRIHFTYLLVEVKQ